jgi:hypothetical protein
MMAIGVSAPPSRSCSLLMSLTSHLKPNLMEGTIVWQEHKRSVRNEWCHLALRLLPPYGAGGEWVRPKERRKTLHRPSEILSGTPRTSHQRIEAATRTVCSPRA